MAKLKSNLSAYADLTKDLITMSLEETAGELLARIRARVPVDTGDLKRSYKSLMINPQTMMVGSYQYQGVYARGYPTFYAPWVEFGGQHEKQPHFVPAWTQAQNIFVSRFKANLREL